jgi:lipopolysaccharide biosynthesis glycosyltransferase
VSVHLDVLCRKEQKENLNSCITMLPINIKERLDLRIICVPQKIVETYDSLVYSDHFKAEICFRLCYFDIIEPRDKAVLYTDCDVLFLGDVAEFLNHLPKDVPVAAIMNAESISDGGLIDSNYFNSGILLFNALHHNLSSAMKCSQRAVQDISSKSLYLDQDGLNFGFEKQWSALDRRFNWVTTSGDLVEAAKADAVVLHATGTEKPWHLFNSHPFRSAYVRASIDAGIHRFNRYDIGVLAVRGRRAAKRHLGALRAKTLGGRNL